MSAGAAVAAGSIGYRTILAREPTLVVILLTVAGHMLMIGSLAPVLAFYASSLGVIE